MVRTIKGAGRSTATMAAPLSHCGLAKYEVVLHSKINLKFLVFPRVCVYTKGCMQGIVWIEPDNM